MDCESNPFSSSLLKASAEQHVGWPGLGFKISIRSVSEEGQGF